MESPRDLSPEEKRALLKKRLAARLSPESHPLSPGQQALWFLWKLAPDSPAYNLFLAGDVPASVDLHALEGAVATLVQRHPQLRTTYTMRNGVPRQIIGAAPGSVWTRVNAHSWSDVVLDAHLAAEAHRPFDLENGPVIRFSCFSQADGSHTLLLVVHHIAADFWSLVVLFDELARLYSLTVRNAPDNERLPSRFVDAVRRQRDLIAGKTGDRDWAYWREHLADLPPPLDLPTDFPRPTDHNFQGAAHPFYLDEDTTRRLRELAKRENTTLYTVLLTAFQVLLHRYTGRDTFLIGSPAAGRDRADVSSTIGYFVNPLPLRTDCRDTRTFRESLDRTRATVLEALAHAALPFPVIVERLQPARVPGRSPLFDVMFVMEQAHRLERQGITGFLLGVPGTYLHLGELEFKTRPIAPRAARFDLTLIVGEIEEFIGAAFHYRTDLWDKATVVRLARNFRRLIASICADPDRPLAELDLLADAEYNQVVVGWNRTRREWTDQRCFPEVFAERAAETPDAPAVVCEGTTLSYGELNRRANRLARRLRTLGVGPDTVVAVRLPRSVGLVVAILGILKAGGAYLPIEPALPEERAAILLAETGSPVLVAAAGPSFPNVRTVSLEDSDHVPTDDGSVAVEVSGEHAAYVIFTSGSTGTPKGVVVEHRQLMNYVQGILDQLGEVRGAHLAMVSTFAADLGHTMVFPALAGGGCLHVVTTDRATDPDALAEYFERHAIDYLKIVPSHLAALLSAANPAAIIPRRRLVLGGEAASWDLIARVRALRPETAILNHYGPTETTVGVLTLPIEADSRAWPKTHAVPLGRPLPNVRAYVLDRSRRPVPIGVPGELYIGGECVARGYVNRPDLTAERFPADPFRSTPNSRMYRTGDLVRRLADGTIDFLGRTDDQVKIRGYRIEPAEIVAALKDISGIRDAVVMAREDVPGEKRLVAYVVADATDQVPSELRRRLPEYMVPAALVVLDRFPLTPNGKLDRRALPAPDAPARESASHDAPRTREETLLARIWCAVLRRDRIGRDDNFFALGGDSILAIQVVAKANQAGLRITPRQMLEHQTIAELAAVAGRATEPVSVADTRPITGEVPPTPAQRRFFELEPAAPHHWNMAFQFTVRRPVTTELLEQAFHQLVLHHDMARARFLLADGRWTQWIEPPATRNLFSIEEIDLTDLSEAERTARHAEIVAETQASLDLARGPLLRGVLFQGETGQHLLVVVHHLIMDGVSWGILLGDLQTICRQLTAGQPVAVPPKTTSFKHWAEHLAAAAPSLIPVAAYWLDALPDDVPPFPAPAIETTEATTRTLSLSLTEEETRRLVQGVPNAFQVRVPDVLLTALALTFGEWTRQAGLLVDLEGHGRETFAPGLDLTRTIGWFTAVYPVWVPFADTPARMLTQVKETLRRLPATPSAYGVVRYLAPDSPTARRLREKPRAEIGFNYLGQFDLIADDALFAIGAEEVGPTRAPDNQRRYLFDVNCLVIDGRLRVHWGYSDRRVGRETVERLAERFLVHLRDTIAYCLTTEATGFTPSDFPLVQLDQPALDRVVGSRRAIADILPLTPTQTEMLRVGITRAEATTPYLVQAAYEVRGPLDIDAFHRAWEETVRAHPGLRVSFVWENLPQPLQLVHQRIVLPWRFLDWRGRTESEQSRELQTFLEADRDHYADFGQPPLMRVTLIQTNDRQWVLVWTRHHLLLDGWGQSLVLDEVLRRYRAVQDEGYFVPRATVGPREYVAWLVGRDRTLDEAFWRRYLAGVRPPATILPTSGNYAKTSLILPAEATAALGQTARRLRVTLNVLLQGVWARLLGGLLGTEDVVFGAVFSGRSAPVERLTSYVGICINTLPVRVSLGVDALSEAWFQRLSAKQVELTTFEHTALSAIHDWCASSGPLFQTVMRFQNYPGAPSLDSASLTFNPMDWTDLWPYPLNLVVFPGHELNLSLTYDTACLDADRASRTLDEMRDILDKVVALHPIDDATDTVPTGPSLTN